MTLDVIGAGFGRTGTDSMREALNILGFGPCHHMVEVTTNDAMKGRWRSFVAGGTADWESLFEGYRSCVDWPAAHYWRDLLDYFPDAPVILTWRDSDSWWTSFEATLLKYFQTTKDHDSVGYQIIANTFGDRAGDRDHVVKIYEAHIAEVVATVPKNRLLVHRLGDGWAPLCDHLGVPVPDAPYPHRNTTTSLKKRLDKSD